MVLLFMLILLLVAALLSTYLRKRAVRWLFTLLSVVTWVAFLAILGFVGGYQMGEHGVHVARILF
ncbi:MAG: hypothetical protein K6T30_04415 [Alicyclobacillus sp.]|nr:hypothetical protein [Alicyclobacillus sp.]